MPRREFKVENLKIRLDKYLAEQMKDISRSQIQREIEAGKISVNGRIIKESKFVVRLNDSIGYRVSGIEREEEKIQATKIPLKILYNNYGLLIIDKPAGLVVHPGAGFKGETLTSALLYQFSAKGGSQPKADQPLAGATNFGGKDIAVVGEEGRPGIVHRLDKDTSGVMLVAETPAMYEHLKNAFQERKVKKEYIALVLGKVEKPHGFIDTPIGRSKRDFRKYDVKNVIQSKEALTEYWVLEYLNSENQTNQKIRKSDLSDFPVSPAGRQATSDQSSIDIYTLLRVKLHTGRTHQIRVHFNSIGHPLMGDRLYGGKRTALDGLDRQFLHAKKIEVQLPERTWIEAESGLPDDLKEVLKKLNSKIINQL